MRTDLAEQPAHSLLALKSTSRATRTLVAYPQVVLPDLSEHLLQGIGSLLLSNQIIYPMATNRSPAETARSFLDV